MSLQEIEKQIEALTPTEFAELARWMLAHRPVAPQSKNALDVLFENAGSLSMPPDWAEEHEHYLYGVPKQHQNEQ